MSSELAVRSLVTHARLEDPELPGEELQSTDCFQQVSPQYYVFSFPLPFASHIMILVEISTFAILPAGDTI